MLHEHIGAKSLICNRMKIVQIDSSQFEQPVSMDGACSCLKEEMAQRKELVRLWISDFFNLLSSRENFLLIATFDSLREDSAFIKIDYSHSKAFGNVSWRNLSLDRLFEVFLLLLIM